MTRSPESATLQFMNTAADKDTPPTQSSSTPLDTAAIKLLATLLAIQPQWQHEQVPKQRPNYHRNQPQ